MADVKTPQKGKKRRASFDKTKDSDDNTWKLLMNMYSCEWAEHSFDKINSALVDTEIPLSSEAPQWCMAKHAKSNSLSLIVQTSSSSAKWLKLCNMGTLLFDRVFELTSPSAFPTAIVGRNDALVLFFCTSSQPVSDVSLMVNGQNGTTNRDGRIEVWNARYGVQRHGRGAAAIPFPVAADMLKCDGCAGVTVYTNSGLVTFVFGRRIGSAKSPSYEAMHYILNGIEYPDLLMLDSTSSNSQSSLSATIGKLAPSATSSTPIVQSISKANNTKLVSARHSPDLSELDAVEMLYCSLIEEADSLKGVETTREIAQSLIKRTQGFSSSILSACIRRHLSASSAAVCLQVFSQLLFGVCTDVCSGEKDEKMSPEFDSHIQQAVCWIEAVLDAHLSSFILGCQGQDSSEVQQPVEEEEKPKKKKSKKKSKEAEEEPSPVVNLFRSALMSLLKALTQLEESQDMTEEALALSCHLQRMVKSSTRSAANKASASAKSNAVNGASSQDVWNGGSGGDASGLYQLEIIHY